MHRRGPGVAHPSRAIAVVAGLALFLATACGSSVTPSPSVTAPSASASSPSPTPDLTLIPTEPGTSPAPTPPGQTDTEWGRIWDTIPATFPAYPGAHPTETGAGPASAVLDAGAAKPAEVVSFYESALAGQGLSTVSRDGPREDASYDLLMGDNGSCSTEITAAPLGGSTIITIMYGAGCPFP